MNKLTVEENKVNNEEDILEKLIKKEIPNTTIRNDIKSFFLNKNCVACGNTNNTKLMFKNDLYNYLHTPETKIQKKEDFQVFCNNCSVKKINIYKNTVKNKKRYSALNIPVLNIHKIAFSSGDETFNVNNVHTMKGTYWYDPVEFMDYLLKNLKENKRR